MRALALLAASVVALSGCLSASTLNENLAVPPLPAAVVHRAGLPLDVAPQSVLGAAPQVVQKLLGTRGAEPNIGVTGSGAIFVSSDDYVMRSRDLGDTWEQVYEFGTVHPPDPLNMFLGNDPVGNGDPMLWVDPDTDRIFAPMMFPVLLCSEGIWSDDDGETWQDVPMRCGLPGVDHQKLATGPYVEGSPLVRTGDYPNVVYYCYNSARDLLTGGATNCAVSTDGGLTFPYDNTAADGGSCGGINGHPTAAPNGTVFVGLGESCGTPWVARSEDNGMSWRQFELHVDGLGEAEADPEVAVTPNGMTYYAWRASTDSRLYVVRTADAFATISKPILVSPPDVTSTRFVAMSAGDDGKLAFAYLGTRDTSARPGQANDETRWHLFTTFTVDAEAREPTFVTVQVTPEEDPVQIGYQWEGGGGDPARNLLDFIDSVIGDDGRFYVAFTDGCTEHCAYNATATKQNSRARNTSLAVQLQGPVLRSAATEPAPAQPEAAAPSRTDARGATR